MRCVACCPLVLGKDRAKQALCLLALEPDWEPLLREGILNRERHAVLRPGQKALIVEKGWIRNDWLQEQLSDVSAVERDHFSLSTCLHLELWLRAVRPQSQDQ